MALGLRVKLPDQTVAPRADRVARPAHLHRDLTLVKGNRFAGRSAESGGRSPGVKPTQQPASVVFRPLRDIPPRGEGREICLSLAEWIAEHADEIKGTPLIPVEELRRVVASSR
jgi:hypothetical protein